MGSEPGEEDTSSLPNGEPAEELALTVMMELDGTAVQDESVTGDVDAGGGVWTGRLHKRPQTKDARGRGP